MTTQMFTLKDNYSIRIISDTWEKTITVHLIDEVNNITTTIATWISGKWNSDTPIGINKFFEVTKKYPKVKRAVKNSFILLKENSANPVVTFTKTWNCFCRKINIKIYNIVK